MWQSGENFCITGEVWNWSLFGDLSRISELGNSDMKEMVRISLPHAHFELPYGFIQLFTTPVGKNWTAIIIFAKWHGNYATSGKKRKNGNFKKKKKKITIHWCVNFSGFVIFELKCTF